MSEQLDCGHPIACKRDDGDDETYCAWCEDIERLTRENASLRAQIGKTALVYKGGEHTLVFCGEIGLVELQTGTVLTIERPKGVNYLDVGQA